MTHSPMTEQSGTYYQKVAVAIILDELFDLMLYKRLSLCSGGYESDAR